MRGARPWALLGLLLSVALAGCGGAPDGELPRGQLPVDIDAPPPEPVEEPPELIEPPEPTEPFTIFGRVLNPEGVPIVNASVWIEGANLRDPRNNADLYVAQRDATLVRTNASGRYEFHLEGGFYHVIAHKSGFIPQRSAPAPVEDKPTRVDFHLVRDDGPKPIAHRGAAFYAPENTLSAVRKAVLLGAPIVEVDVHLTGDNQLVVFHDFDLDRTTNGTGPVILTSLDTIRKLDAGAWFHQSFRGEAVPTVAEVLALGRESKVRIVLDIKAGVEWSNQTHARVLDEVVALGYQDVAIVASFDTFGVAACARRANVTCALISRGPGDGATIVNQTRALGARTLLLRHSLVDAATVEHAAARQVTLYTWTLNEPEEWGRFVPLGVAGVITDRPGYFIDYLNDRALGRV